MRISEFITRLFRRVLVEWVVAAMMLALAYFDLTAHSLTVIRLERDFMPREAQAALLAAGGVFALLSRGRDWLFYLSTVQLLVHVITSLVVTLENRGGYHTDVMYGGFLLLMYVIYARQEVGNCE